MARFVNVAYMPGIFGSRLALTSGVAGGALDVFPPALVSPVGLMIQLQLAGDGLSPGRATWGFPLSPVGLYEPQYGPLSRFMQQRGWSVYEAAYDWRLSVRQSAAVVWAALQAAFGSEPFCIVAHSMGGLVARAVYGLMAAAGVSQQLVGLVTLGTPHFGSWEAVRGFFGLPTLYQALAWFAILQLLLTPATRLDYLDLILASWPGWYELLPWRDAGPLAIQDPATAQALYNPATYAGGNPYLNPAWLANAVQTQHYLAPLIPFGQAVAIRGVNFVTAFEVNPPNPLSQLSGYQYTGGGDGNVPSNYAVMLSAPNCDRMVAHGDLPRDPRVWPAVVWAVQQFFGPGA